MRFNKLRTRQCRLRCRCRRRDFIVAAAAAVGWCFGVCVRRHATDILDRGIGLNI